MDPAPSEITIDQVEALLSAWRPEEGAPPRRIDLSRVLDIDTAGVQLLYWLTQYGRCELLAPSAAVRDAADLLGLSDTLFPVAEPG